MRKKDLIDYIAEKYEVTKKAASDMIEIVTESVKDAVAETGEVDLYGFMKITKVYKDAAVKRNPRTGENIDVPAKYVPKAKFAKAFKDLVKGE